MDEWVNWSGSLRFTPGNYLKPAHEEELRDIVSRHYADRQRIRIAGAGHSSSPLVKTPDTLIHLENLKGIVEINEEEQTATLRTGMTVNDANKALERVNLALFNTGDVDVQLLAGAISTGTHGTGRKLQNLSSMLTAVKMVNYKGEVLRFSEKENEEAMKGIRVSLGSLGIFTEITVKVLPVFQLKRQEFFTSVATCRDHFDQLADDNRNVDFYWYPRSDEIKIRILNEPGKGTRELPFKYYCMKEEEGLVGDILPRDRVLKFDEMEYALSREAAWACFLDVRERIRERHRKEVAWRVLFRTIASDTNYLSPHYGRDSVSISLHHNAGLPFDDFFNDIEPIFIRHGGRPHWGKKHNLTGTALKDLYPEWNRFHQLRRSLDPEGFFMNDHLNKLFNADE